MRDYLEQQYALKIEATTAEIIEIMEKQSWLKQEEIKTFLTNSDLVKFAKVQPEESDFREIIALAREIVS